MNEISRSLQHLLKQSIIQSFGEDYGLVDPLLHTAQNPKFGDYQSDVAMSLAKHLGRNSREVATEIAATADINGLCDKLEVAGPGFINIRLSSSVISKQLLRIAADHRLGIAKHKSVKTVVVDYSGPNVAKEMHVGHLRSTIIGDALAHVLEFFGHHVIRQNHLGDWGTQFGMLIQYIIETDWTPSDENNVSNLNNLYKDSRIRFDNDPDFAEKSRNRVVLLQRGDPQSKLLWQQLVSESRAYINSVYQCLDVSLTDADTRGESAYNEYLEPMVNELTEIKLAEKEQGATVVYHEEFKGRDNKPLPLIIQKSDNGFLYATTDLACLRYRVQELQANRLIYITDSRQNQHFEMVFKTAEKAGWLDSGITVEHVPFGSVLGEDGKPFKTRSGETIRLMDLIEGAVSQATETIKLKKPELNENQQNEIANTIAIGAIKYADLSVNRVKDYIFSWERMLAMEGNTAPYMQYAHTRIHSIFRKGVTQGGYDVNLVTEVQISTDMERQLSLKLLQLDEALESVAQRLEPHRLCTYLFELATQFNSFYEACPVLKAETKLQRDSRLLLCDLTAKSIKLGLSLLGIRVPEKM